VPTVGKRRATLIAVLTLSFIIVISLHIEQAKAKVTAWDALPDAITEPTTIIIVSPEGNQTYNSDNVTLIVNVGVQPIYEDGGNTHYIRSVSYKGDWMEQTERIFYHLTDWLMAKKITITINVTGLSDGLHNLTVYAYDSYSIETPTTVNFSIDTQNPIPEFPSWVILPLLLVATVVVAVARKKLVRKRLD
jgi:hypothetical protein